MTDDKAPSRTLWGRPDDDRFVWGPDDIEIMTPKSKDAETKLSAAEQRYLGLVSIPVPVAPHESHTKTGKPIHVDAYVRHIDVDVNPELLKLHPSTREVAPPSPLPNAPGDQFFNDLSPGAQAFVLHEMAINGITSQPIYDEIRDRIGSKDEAIRLGKEWYEDAHSLADGLAKKFGISIEQAAGVIAGMSPRTEWGMNAECAAHFIELWRDGRFKDMTPEQARDEFALIWVENAWGGWTKVTKKDDPSLAKYVKDGMRPALPSFMESGAGRALAILNDPDSLDEQLSTIKIRSFYENIMDPHGTWDVTVDTHMGKAFAYAFKKSKAFVESFVSRKSEKKERRNKAGEVFQEDSLVQGVGYIVIAGAVRQLADEWGIAPDIIQAAYWIKVQKLNPGTEGFSSGSGVQLPSPFASSIAGKKLS